jgi:hypothetical protein
MLQHIGRAVWHLSRIKDVFSGAGNQAKFRHYWLPEAPHTGGDLHIMKTLILAAALALALSTAAFAGECQDDIEKIDAALASGNVGPDQRAQLEDMRNQAVQLCGAGNEAEGLDVTAEAKAMLNIQ